MISHKKPKRSGQALIISMTLHLIFGLCIFYIAQKNKVFEREDSISVSFVVPPKIEMKKRIREIPRIITPIMSKTAHQVSNTVAIQLTRSASYQIAEVRIESPEIVRESVEITSTAPLSRSLPKAITAIKLKPNEQASIDLPVVTPTVVASGIGILSTRVRAKSEGGSGLADRLADVGTTAPRQLVIDSTGDHSGQDAFGIGSYVEKTRDGRPQEVMYLLDVSSSMNKQNKLQLAVSALKDAVKMLKSADQFNLITFDANIHLYSKSLLTATLENVSTACRFLNQLQNGSGTNLSTAIEDGLKLTPSTLVVVSDGDPSRGIQDPDQICRMVRRWNISQTRIMTIALGSDHSDGGVRLLQQLASDHNGQMLFISLK